MWRRVGRLAARHAFRLSNASDRCPTSGLDAGWNLCAVTYPTERVQSVFLHHISKVLYYARSLPRAQACTANYSLSVPDSQDSLEHTGVGIQYESALFGTVAV